jgi:hypothetical protein
MHALTKKLIRSGAVAVGLSLAGIGAASAGEWRIKANKCPDLREDRWDKHHYHGRSDRREDWRDEHVVKCPASAWYYVPGPHERRGFYSTPRPVEVIVHADGGHFYRDRHGVLLALRIG